MLVIILDAKCATQSAKEGIELCLRTVIPSLLPFFVLSAILNSCLLGKTIPFLRPLGQLCHIPKGGESLLLLGYITGYPIGAQLISQASKDKSLSKNTARRMLGFCNNAGPAFIFGILSPIFSGKLVPWVLWGIHIASSIIVGCLLPFENDSDCIIKKPPVISPVKALYNALRSIAAVCGWVVLFRILLGYFSRWFLWRLPLSAQVIFSGVLELANGCIELDRLASTGLKFIIASGILAFGGLCVGMQTRSVTQGLGSGYYFPGKILQAIFSILLSAVVQQFIFDPSDTFSLGKAAMILLSAGAILMIFILRRKKVVAFGRRMLYNSRNHSAKGATLCCFAKK